MITRLEAAPRGRYAAPIGWVDANGDGEFAIALRCAQLSGNVARLWAGAGIVADSDPDSEVAETTVKFDAVLSARLVLRTQLLRPRSDNHRRWLEAKLSKIPAADPNYRSNRGGLVVSASWVLILADRAAGDRAEVVHDDRRARRAASSAPSARAAPSGSTPS